MSFDGTEGASISRTDAGTMTANYRTKNPGDTKGHFIGKEILESILAQTDCQGIRIYYGIDGEDAKQLIIAGADSNEDDILDLIADYMVPCPSRCGTNNVLNS